MKVSASKLHMLLIYPKLKFYCTVVCIVQLWNSYNGEFRKPKFYFRSEKREIITELKLPLPKMVDVDGNNP